MRRPFVLASLAAALTLGSAFAGDTKEGYGWKFTKGEKVRYAYVYNLESKIEIMGMPQSFKQDARLEMTEVTKDVDKDGNATIDGTLERLAIDIVLPPMMGGTVHFDTDEKDTSKKKDDKKKADDDDDDDAPKGGMGGMGGIPKDAFKPLNDAVGAKFSFKITKEGKISELTGIKELSEKLSEKLPGGGGMGGGGFALLDPEVLQQTLELHCHVFPSGDAGASWDIPTSIVVPSLGALEFTRTIKPKGDDGLTHTASKPELKPVKSGIGAPNPMAAQLGKPKVKDTGYEGTSKLSADKGRVVSDELIATLSSDYEIDNPMGGGKGMKKGGDDGDDDDDAPKKKDEKKKEDKKKSDDDDDDNGGGGGGGAKMKFTQKFKLTLKYELMDGKSADKPAEKKDEKKKDGDF